MPRNPYYSNRGEEPSSSERILQLAQAAQAMGLGFEPQKLPDPNEMAKIAATERIAKGEQQQLPNDAAGMLMQKAMEDPALMAQVLERYGFKPAQGGPAGGANSQMAAEAAKMLAGGQASPAAQQAVSRVPVKPSSWIDPTAPEELRGMADALINEKGEIVGYAKPNTQELIKGYFPSSESVGGWEAFSTGLGNAWDGLWNFFEPKFQQAPQPIKR